MPKFTLPFDEINHEDVTTVGGKNASLGEMFSQLTSEGIDIPDGFSTTAEAYCKFIENNNLRDELTGILDKLDTEEFSNLEERSSAMRWGWTT